MVRSRVDYSGDNKHVKTTGDYLVHFEPTAVRLRQASKVFRGVFPQQPRPYFPFTFLSLSCREAANLETARVMGDRCKLSGGVCGEVPVDKDFGVF